jgi:hypothetical protein
VSTIGVVIVPGPNVWAWSMAGSDRQHQEEDASAHLHYSSERLYRCGSLLLIGQAYCRRQRASQKPPFLLHCLLTGKVSVLRCPKCCKSRLKFYDPQTVPIFGFATCPLAMPAFLRMIRPWICNSTLSIEPSVSKFTRSTPAARMQPVRSSMPALNHCAKVTRWWCADLIDSAEVLETSFNLPTIAGLKAARSRGRRGGRPKKLQSKDLKTIKALLKTNEVSVQEVAVGFGVSRSTLYRNGLA